MSKESYFEMCEQLGTDPKDEETPVELEDLTGDSNIVLYIFTLLSDRWGEASGTYMGKDLSNIDVFFKLLEVPKSKWLLYIELISVLVYEQSEYINKKQQSKIKLTEKG